MRTPNHNIGAWLLLLITVMLTLSPSVAPLHSTPFINQLETSIPSPSQPLNLQGNLPQEAAVIQSSCSVGYMKSNGINMVEPNITSTENAYNGYNLFILDQQTQTDPPKHNRSLLVTNMEGVIIRDSDNKVISLPQDVWFYGAKFINSTTLLYGTKEGGALWNIYNKTTVNLGFESHHEYVYNPLNNTIFTHETYIDKIDEIAYRFDCIKEYDITGQLVWSLDSRSFISHIQWCPYKDLYNGNATHIPSIKMVADITHSNSLFFDPDEDVFYYNVRNINTFYKIDHKTGQVLWGLGEYGNFTLFDRHGNQRQNLFYHAHAVEKVDEDTFILFDNDKHNQTNPMNHRSRIMEITINETTMTAHESWSWTAPPDYYSAIYGDADRLPNGNRLGTFGTYQHPPNTDIGARLVEVNEEGQIVWEMNFPNTEDFMYGVYRMERFRFSPILNPLPDIRAITTEDVTVQWQTWYNFRTSRRMKGTYTLYLDGTPIEKGTHVFDKFWRPTNLTVNLGNLEAGDYNLTLVLADEAGHITTDSLNLSITELYLEREGPLTFELGQENALLQWKGSMSKPLLANITINNTQLASYMWNGSVITLDLNGFNVGTYIVSLQLFDDTKLIHEDRVLVTIYPAAAPVIHSSFTDQYLTWNDSLVLFWEIFDHIPESWSILVNDTFMTTGMWETPSYQLHWSVPILDEGRYNITLAAYDRAGHRTARTTWLTVVPPSHPIIATCPNLTEIQWGQENTLLSWEVHGGTHWRLWKNRKAAYSGEITIPRIEIQIEDWQREDWRPGTYNLTLQVVNAIGTAVSRTNWLQIWDNFGDVYADTVITEASMWYSDGDHALGPPDSKVTHLYFDYGNGHVTLDMGAGEEVLDGKGVDFTVYSLEGEYAVFVGNNLSAPIVGSQAAPPIMLLGEGQGNASFDLASVGLAQARYIQVVYLAGEKVELDAVVAIHFNHPPRPPTNSDHWKVVVSGGILALAAILVLWIRRRSR